MTDALITEHSGTRHGQIIRYYQYGNGGIRVLDARKALRRFYLFDHAANTMTENDPVRREKVLRRFIFDAYGMVEETFSFGQRPRTFRFEAGCSRIAVREGGDYGAVGKLFTFEDNGVSETVWGRNGEIERVFVFESGNDTIVERAGGWFGDIERTIVFEGIDASVFRDPESFLQFVVFTEWSESDRDAQINDEVAKIRSGKPSSPYAYNGPRRGGSAAGGSGSAGPAPRAVSRGPGRSDDSGGIDFIPDADGSGTAAARGVPSRAPGACGNPALDERRQQREREVQGRYDQVRSDEIALQDRLDQARAGRGAGLSKGKSVEIPISDRFDYARQSREQLSPGRSVEIPMDERFGNSRSSREELSKGASVDIPLEERFENARRSREKLSKGRSAEIPYDERRSGNR